MEKLNYRPTEKMGPQGWSGKWNRPSGLSEMAPTPASLDNENDHLSELDASKVAINGAAARLIDARKPLEVAHKQGQQVEPSEQYADAVKKLTDLVANDPHGVTVLWELQKGDASK